MIKESTSEHVFGETSWLNSESRVSEYFVVIDNTEYPEALS